MTIFSVYGSIKKCDVIRDWKTGQSLQFAFIEYETKASCEEAYWKMDNALIDERRIHVDFSQSTSRNTWGKFKAWKDSQRTGTPYQNPSSHQIGGVEISKKKKYGHEDAKLILDDGNDRIQKTERHNKSTQDTRNDRRNTRDYNESKKKRKRSISSRSSSSTSSKSRSPSPRHNKKNNQKDKRDKKDKKYRKQSRSSSSYSTPSRKRSRSRKDRRSTEAAPRRRKD